MKNINSIKEFANELVGDLIENGQTHGAKILNKQIEKLNHQDTIIEALTEIESYCHVKALGDLYLETFSGWEWPNKVSKLGEKCRKTLKAIKTKNCT